MNYKNISWTKSQTLRSTRAFVSYPTTVIKYSDTNNLRDKGFIPAPSSRLQSIMAAKLEASGHITLAIKNTE